MKKLVSLDKLDINKSAKIKKINCNLNIRRRFLDLGIIPNTNITPILKSVGGDPTAYEIRGILLAIRNEDSKNILVEI